MRPTQMKHPSKSPLQLGTAVSKALALIGVTEERVSSLFGNCGCKRRERRLNDLSDWAYGVLVREKADAVDLDKERNEFEKILRGVK